MSEPGEVAASDQTVERWLRQLDLATEVMEGLNELGVDSREQLRELMERLERQVADDG